MLAGEIIIRDFHPVLDMEAAYRAFISGFAHSMWPAIKEADPELIKDLMRCMTLFGNRSVVADHHGEAVGLLAGCVRMTPGRVITGLSHSFFTFLPRMAINKYGASRKARKHVQLNVKNYVPFAVFKMPYFTPHCEVLLFTLRGEYRGKGIGRMMMDEFVRRAKSGGANRVVLATDTTASWKFYPNYGFERVLSHPLKDCFSVALPGEEVTGYIYSLNLHEE